MKWNGMELVEMEWNGIGRNGMEWNGLREQWIMVRVEQWNYWLWWTFQLISIGNGIGKKLDPITCKSTAAKVK